MCEFVRPTHILTTFQCATVATFLPISYAENASGTQGIHVSSRNVECGVLKREPGVNPGLPRSGKQERNPIQALLKAIQREAGRVGDGFAAQNACQSEDLP
jgi:hypothetical protein